MIFTAFLSFIVFCLSVVLGWLPVVTQLPFGIDPVFVTAIGWIHGLIYNLPFLQVVWNLILWYYSILVTLFILRVIRIYKHEPAQLR